MLTKAFILTSDFFDTANGMQLHFWAHSQFGAVKLIYNQEKNVFFIPRDSNVNLNVDFERKSIKLKSFDFKDVDAIYLKKYEHLKIAKDYCLSNAIRNFEMDIRPTERFLMERFVNGQIEFEYNSQKEILNPQIRKTDYSPNLSILSLDIETGVDGSLYSIGLHLRGKNDFKKVIMLNDEDKNFEEIEFFNSELKMLKRFIDLVQLWDPDLIIGWHVIGFDLMFLEKKCQKFGISLDLGRDGDACVLEHKPSGFFAKVSGRIVLDGPVLLRSSFYNFKNYKLDTVAKLVLGEGKDISSSGNDKVEEIERRFKEDKISLARYNLLDCTLVLDIFDKLELVSLLIKRVQVSGMLMDRVGISTAAFDHFMLPLIHRKGFVAPNSIDIDRDEPAPGALVFTPMIGMHENVAVFDFKSLYPSIIRTFKIDPYSLLQNEVNPLNTPSEIKFSKTENILPNHIESLIYLRAIAKEEGNKSLSQAIKILMNSFYGVMGSSKSRFYHSDLPLAITKTGQWILSQGREFFQNRSMQVIYGDTDSLFVKISQDVNLEKLVNDFNHYLGKVIFDEYGVKSYLELEYEKTFEKIFFPESRSGEVGAKKRYVGYVNDELYFVGMEFVRSDWTELAKKFQYDLYLEYFRGRSLDNVIKQTINELQSGILDESLVITKKLSKDPKEYTKNIPPHVQAALLLNHKGPYRLKEISYYMCLTGPTPIDFNPKDFDYQYYLDKQLRPVANDILKYLNDSFDSYLVGNQLSLF